MRGDRESFLRLVHVADPRVHRRLVSLTDDQIALVQGALAHWDRSVADTSYDPQVGEWARTHGTGTRESVAAISQALETSTVEIDW